MVLTPFAQPPYPYPVPPYAFYNRYGPSLQQTPTRGNAIVPVDEHVDLQSSPLAMKAIKVRSWWIKSPGL
jgi:hypothetical protein